MTPDRLVGPSVDLLVCGFENEKVVLLMFWEMLLMTPDKTNLFYVFCFYFNSYAICWDLKDDYRDVVIHPGAASFLFISVE